MMFIIITGIIILLFYVYYVIDKYRNKTFYKICELIKSGENVFITGGAGTGKSYIIKKLVKKFPYLDNCVTSTTGISALNIDGCTIHHWLKIGMGNDVKEAIKNIKNNEKQLKKIMFTKALIIDEVSMLGIKLFENIDKILKEIRQNDKPFGGIQLIVIGDFCQLPPVKDFFCFNSNLWKELNFTKVVLKKVWRQKDKSFVKILNEIRFTEEGHLADNVLNCLKENIIIKENEVQEKLLHIFPYKKKVKEHNLKCLNMIACSGTTNKAVDFNAKIVIKDNEREYTAKEATNIKDNNSQMRAEKILSIKKDCRVMLIKNLDVKNGLVNGAIGTVKEHNKECITVIFDNKKTGTKNIKKEYFEIGCEKPEYDVTVREQFPLVLAYAINIHKSQGLSLNSAVIDIHDCWASGQAYVALSRVKSKKNLYILQKIDKDKIYTDSNAIKISK